ncbi:hypothetical protein TrispH2_006483 [Trichoplax sp. H2]|nr:hypothetical protein TrispH2_006483 [Trichoplax sp. H2]|eukprot:RDD41337.1 hypothetical protein TrispH2_006483 [Trichoplax sp. H2]
MMITLAIGNVEGVLLRSLFLSPSGSIRVKDKSTLTLNCTTSSYNGTTNVENIQWFKIGDNNQSLLQPSGQRRAIRVGDHVVVQLHWNRINSTDNGRYRCQWSQFSQNNDVTVNVEGPPTLAITSAKTLSGYVYMRWKLYNSGNTPVLYQVSRTIVNNGIASTNLIIGCLNTTTSYCRTIAVDFIVDYCVRAVRNHDIVITACVLRYNAFDEVVPSPPINLHVIKDKGPYLNLTWATAQDYAIYYDRIVNHIRLCYDVRFPIHGNPTCLDLNKHRKAYSFNNNLLQYGYLYEFYLKTVAKNNKQSAPSSKIYTNYYESTPTGSPEKFMCNCKQPSFLKLKRNCSFTWEYPLQRRNGNLTHAYINLVPFNNPEGIEYRCIDGNKFQAEFILWTNTSYNGSIVVSNSIGNSSKAHCMIDLAYKPITVIPMTTDFVPYTSSYSPADQGSPLMVITTCVLSVCLSLLLLMLSIVLWRYYSSRRRKKTVTESSQNTHVQSRPLPPLPSNYDYVDVKDILKTDYTEWTDMHDQDTFLHDFPITDDKLPDVNILQSVKNKTIIKEPQNDIEVINNQVACIDNDYNTKKVYDLSPECKKEGSFSTSPGGGISLGYSSCRFEIKVASEELTSSSSSGEYMQVTLPPLRNENGTLE